MESPKKVKKETALRKPISSLSCMPSGARNGKRQLEHVPFSVSIIPMLCDPFLTRSLISSLRVPGMTSSFNHSQTVFFTPPPPFFSLPTSHCHLIHVTATPSLLLSSFLFFSLQDFSLVHEKKQMTSIKHTKQPSIILICFLLYTILFLIFSTFVLFLHTILSIY